MNVVLVVITDGRIELLEQTIEAAKKYLDYPFYRKMLVNDCPGASDYLKKTYPDFTIFARTEKKGLAGAVQLAWENLPTLTDYVFHLEEDFVMKRPIPIDDMIEILQLNSYLSQVVLLRQPWSHEEKVAGGMLQHFGVANNIHRHGNLSWIEQRNYFSLNPSIYSVEVTRDGWPDSNEAGFTAKLNQDPNHYSAFLGEGEEYVEHIGYYRSGDWKE